MNNGLPPETFIVPSKDIVEDLVRNLSPLTDCDYDADQVVHDIVTVMKIVYGMEFNNLEDITTRHFENHVFNYEDDRYVWILAYVDFISKLDTRFFVTGFFRDRAIFQHYQYAGHSCGDLIFSRKVYGTESSTGV